MTSALFSGLFLGASMIIPLGVQNSYVLSQGIKKNHHFLTATICMVCDVVLIALGIFGGGELISSSNIMKLVMGWGGIIFLTTYSSISFIKAWKNQYGDPESVSALSSRKAVVGTTLAVTLLNPHVYLDTVMILGSVGGTFAEQEKLFFALGTILASILWFYSLAGGAAKLAPWLAKPKAQRLIDIFIGSIMLFVTFKLFTSLNL